MGLAPWEKAQTQTFDHNHVHWTALLKKHVVLLRGGQASEVRYAGFAADRAQLKAYLDSLSAVTADGFAKFTPAKQQACPMLREEAYAANKLEAQLTQQTQRFMADRTRNRFNPKRGQLELSRIFDWYGEDFRLGHRGLTSVGGFAAMHADLLADAPADRDRVRQGQLEVRFLDYDWALNDAS